MPYFSSVETMGAGDEPDIVYYNADIINNNTDDTAKGIPPGNDPQIRFNETRDTYIIKDASKYEFSIVRFQMNGAGLDLPLFIPSVVVGQPNINLTEYALAISFTQTWQFNNGSTRTFTIQPLETPILYDPETESPVLAPIPKPPLIKQDLSSRYYWVYSYQHWVDLINKSIYNPDDPFNVNSAMYKVWLAFQTAWNANAPPGNVFPYADVKAMIADPQGFAPPFLKYEATSRLFTWYADERAFGTRLTAVVAPAPNTIGATTAPVARLFLNSNLYGLLGNFDCHIWNYGIDNPLLEGYYAEILFPNELYTNIYDLSNNAPPYVPASDKHIYWVNTQDYNSTSNLWSPIASIVFTSTLLPLKTEATGEPIRFGEGNLGYSSGTAQSAFQPIITDIGIDLQAGGAESYRQFIYYTPTAEYRMSAFEKSKQEIRNIDIQVWWKSRLDNQLYPVQMYNLSSVSLKIMFRKRPADRLSSY
jgi:hypothetical protein